MSKKVRFQVLTENSMKMVVFWDVAPCSPVDINHVLEVITASIIRAIATRLHGATSQKTVILSVQQVCHRNSYLWLQSKSQSWKQVTEVGLVLVASLICFCAACDYCKRALGNMSEETTAVQYNWQHTALGYPDDYETRVFGKGRLFIKLATYQASHLC
jgi:hypothetical protein